MNISVFSFPSYESVLKAGPQIADEDSDVGLNIVVVKVREAAH